jgi:hypothetical protein
MSYRITITHTDPERFGEDELLYADTWLDVTEKLDNASTWAFDSGFVKIERISEPEPPEYNSPEEDEYLDSLERDSIDGPAYWQESGAYALGY